MKRLYPDKKWNAGNRCGDVTEDQDFDFLKFVHQPFAIDIVERRSQAAPEDQDVPRQKPHLAERGLAQVAGGK